MPATKESEYTAASSTGVGLGLARSSQTQTPLWQNQSTNRDYRDYRDPNEPPIYSQDEPNLRDRIQELAVAAHGGEQDMPIHEYPFPEVPNWRRDRELDATTRRRQDIVSTFFDAIRKKQDEVVAALIESEIITTETTNKDGRTPLLAAIEAGNIRTVQQLMDFDAKVNAFGIVAGMPPPAYGRKPDKIRRTPLMIAAEKGNLTIVKLLMETYGADDSLVANDGELALRLAASNGHREVVDYLPSRRGGGFRRWKTKHGKAMRRIKDAGQQIYGFLRILFYEIPKFIVWTAPKHCIVLPIIRGVKWLHKHRAELPHRIAMWFQHAWGRLKKVPGKIWKFIKWIPKAVKGFAEFVWDSIKTLPKAIKIAVLWIWEGVKRAGTAVSNVLARFLSFVHTALVAIATFFRNITLKDVWDGFVAFLRTVIIDGPKKLWEWICKFGDVTRKMLQAMWGFLGLIIWWLLRGIIELFIYIPKRLIMILASCGTSIGSGFREVLIWFNPKRQ